MTTAPVVSPSPIVIPGWGENGETIPERLDAELIARAYRFSEQAHAGQTRHSGEPFVSHCVQVARILADLGLDTATVVSGLIHDVVEDTGVTVKEVEKEFGKEVAEIVDGLTKIAHLPTGSREDRSRTTASSCCRSPRMLA
jgi:GTP diphosphokinase / guanosine-3',5'-bis(diphosphate) 3'-diphosphatase